MSYRASDGRNAVWPPPIYVATLANGAMVRMSFYSRRGKPLDFDRGRRACESTIHDDGSQVDGLPRWRQGSERACLIASCPEFRRQFQHRPIAGHVEHGGETIPDPYFAANVVSLAKARPSRPEVSPLAALLRRAADVCASDRAMALQLVLQAQADLDPMPAFNEPHPASIPVHYPKAWRR